MSNVMFQVLFLLLFKTQQISDTFHLFEEHQNLYSGPTQNGGSRSFTKNPDINLRPKSRTQNQDPSLGNTNNIIFQIHLLFLIKIKQLDVDYNLVEEQQIRTQDVSRTEELHLFTQNPATEVQRSDQKLGPRMWI